MFIIERRTVGVIAALIIPAAVAILSNVLERTGTPPVQATAITESAASREALREPLTAHNLGRP